MMEFRFKPLELALVGVAFTLFGIFIGSALYAPKPINSLIIAGISIVPGLTIIIKKRFRILK